MYRHTQMSKPFTIAAQFNSLRKQFRLQHGCDRCEYNALLTNEICVMDLCHLIIIAIKHISSAYSKSHGKSPRISLLTTSITVMNNSGLSTDNWCGPTNTDAVGQRGRVDAVARRLISCTTSLAGPGSRSGSGTVDQVVYPSGSVNW